MTLNEIIQKYKNEEFSFYKYKNSENENINTYFIFNSQADFLDTYLRFYQQLPSLTEVIVFASEGTFKITQNGFDFFVRHSHQEVFLDKMGNIRGVNKDITDLVRAKLIARFTDLVGAGDFDQIMEIVTQCRVRGFGELSIYDTSLRIARFKNMEPDKVYLHAGARKGFEILERKGYVPPGSAKENYLTTTELPDEFNSHLRKYEVENIACLYKAEFEKLPSK